MVYFTDIAPTNGPVCVGRRHVRQSGPISRDVSPVSIAQPSEEAKAAIKVSLNVDCGPEMSDWSPSNML